MDKTIVLQEIVETAHTSGVALCMAYYSVVFILELCPFHLTHTYVTGQLFDPLDDLKPYHLDDFDLEHCLLLFFP